MSKYFLLKDSHKKPKKDDFRYVHEQSAYCKQRAYINLEDAIKYQLPLCCKCGLYHKEKQVV